MSCWLRGSKCWGCGTAVGLGLNAWSLGGALHLDPPTAYYGCPSSIRLLLDSDHPVPRSHADESSRRSPPSLQRVPLQLVRFQAAGTARILWHRNLQAFAV